MTGHLDFLTNLAEVYIEIQTRVLVACVVEGKFEIMEIFINDVCVVYLLLVVLFLALLLLHLSYIS